MALTFFFDCRNKFDCILYPKSFPMPRIYLLLVLAAFSFTHAAAQRMPKYREVAKYFFSQYEVPMDDRVMPNFEKQRDGWYLALRSYDHLDQVAKRHLFWSAETKKYERIPDMITQKDPVVAKRAFESFIEPWSEMNFNISPYFGYNGWYKDVITDFAHRSNLTDTLVYALGRAYSNKAVAYLNNFGGYNDPFEQFQLPFKRPALSPEQLALYRESQQLAVATFKLLAEKNPRFQTITGSIKTKLWNEQVASFLHLLTYQDEAEALKEIPEGLYTKPVLDSAIATLNACKPDAVLVTFGDNDTYPLLYVQSRMRVRRDVVVMNYSLIGTDRYLYFLQDGPVMGAQPLTLTMRLKDYEGERNMLFYVQQGKPVAIPNLINALYNDNDPELVSASNDNNAGTAYKTARFSSLTLPPPAGKTTDKPILLCEDQQYLVRNDLVLLDFIANNAWTRPLYFTAYQTGIKGLGKYLKEGAMGLYQFNLPELK
jgi:hypothetical protein